LVVIETSKGERNKYKYDERLRVFAYSSVLPEGQTFPFDFGFIPGTRGDDGDPLDVLLLADAPVPMGCVVTVQLIGVIEAEQSETDGETVRNDRIIAVSVDNVMFDGARSLKDLSSPMLKQIEQFFISYNRIKGKQFKVIGRRGPNTAQRVLDAGIKQYRKA
jgi:inorganic pyrophosphatase